jgi:hypothetical protein
MSGNRLFVTAAVIRRSVRMEIKGRMVIALAARWVRAFGGVRTSVRLAVLVVGTAQCTKPGGAMDNPHDRSATRSSQNGAGARQLTRMTLRAAGG